MCELWLVRHGETEWSLKRAHTGRTDIALTPKGEQQARALAPMLAGEQFSLVLTSPLRRARESAALAGMGAAQIEPDLTEWDYGVYEGRTTAQIQSEQPGWSIWETGVPGGESLQQVGARAQRVIDRACRAGGRVALFGHAHMLRVLAACWAGLPPTAAKVLALSTASLSRLGYEHERRVILSWNLVP
jgi:broad specificity phosphatase PhoE